MSQKREERTGDLKTPGDERPKAGRGTEAAEADNDNEGQSPHHAWTALPLRLASVTGDNAPGDVGVGADVGKGQKIGLATHLFSNETKRADGLLRGCVGRFFETGGE